MMHAAGKAIAAADQSPVPDLVSLPEGCMRGGDQRFGGVSPNIFLGFIREWSHMTIVFGKHVGDPSSETASFAQFHTDLALPLVGLYVPAEPGRLAHARQVFSHEVRHGASSAIKACS